MRNGEPHDEVWMTLPGQIVVFLCNNIIAVIYSDKIILKNCGYYTATTKSRLNAIARHFKLPCIYQKNRAWYWTDGILFNREREFPRTPEVVNAQTLNSQF